MFCFETAVKLLYWSGFAYEDDEASCKNAVCLKRVTMLGMTSERVMCCCTGVDLCKRDGVICGVALFSQCYKWQKPVLCC